MWKVKAQLKWNEVIIPERCHPGEGRGPVFANAKTCVANIYVFHRYRDAWGPLFSGVTILWNFKCHILIVYQHNLNVE